MQRAREMERILSEQRCEGEERILKQQRQVELPAARAEAMCQAVREAAKSASAKLPQRMAWACSFDGCNTTFASPEAMVEHAKVAHPDWAQAQGLQARAQVADHLLAKTQQAMQCDAAMRHAKRKQDQAETEAAQAEEIARMAVLAAHKARARANEAGAATIASMAERDAAANRAVELIKSIGGYDAAKRLLSWRRANDAASSSTPSGS